MSPVELAILMCVGLIAMCSAAIAALGARAISHAKRATPTALRDLLANDYYEAVGVLMPAYDAQDTITDAVRSLLDLQHPQVDITVVNDGSTDDTLQRLIGTFSLVEVPIAHDGGFETAPLRALYRSTEHAALTVIDKQHGGRADALNAGLNIARRPLICVVDANVVLEPRALAAPSRRFVEDETVVAVTGFVRPDDGAIGHDTRSWSQRIQAAELAKRNVAAAGWAVSGGAIDVDGFAIFRRRALQEIGGWSTPTDAETLLALHHINRARRRPYRILHTTEVVGRVIPESTMRGLIASRAHRTRSLATALWAERRMVGRRTYGRVGTFVLPVRAAMDIASPCIEVAGWAWIATSAAVGAFDAGFTAAFVMLTAGTRITLAQLAGSIDGAGASQVSTGSDRTLIHSR